MYGSGSLKNPQYLKGISLQLDMIGLKIEENIESNKKKNESI